MNHTSYKPPSGKTFLLIGLSLAIAIYLITPHNASANPGVLYAAPAIAGVGNCSSWENACTLQTALSSAVGGDEIWVKQGVYIPGSSRTDTFTLKSGVLIYGGFAGTETARSQRDPSANVTILSGDIDSNDTNTDGNSIAETWNDIAGDNSYHVVTGSETGTNAVLDGFVITAGQANGSIPHNRGGGIYNSYGNPTLSNITLSGNLAENYGGGMHNTHSNPTMTNIVFSGNQVQYTGGGMYNDESDPTLIDAVFNGNSAMSGGGMYNISSDIVVTNVTFNGNSATGSGGGLYNYLSNPVLSNVTFSGNTAHGNGGGMLNVSSASTLTNISFVGNSAGYGGGLANSTNSSSTLINTTFTSNSATSGGGMYNNNSSPSLSNVTFSDNSASCFGGGMYNLYSSSPNLTNVTFGNNSASSGGGMNNNNESNPVLTNVIIWGNTATNGQGIFNVSSTPAISNSDIQGCGVSGSWNSACGTDGGSNIDSDPFFLDATSGNLRLGFPSPAIDSGRNSSCPSTDLDNVPRPADGNGDGASTCDMGAYEAGRMDCSISQGNTYTFAEQSSIEVQVVTQGNLACLYVDEMDMDHPNATPGLQTGRYWLIRGVQSDRQTSANGFSINLTLPTIFTPDDNDKVCRYTGSGQVWDCAMSTFTSNTITRNGITALSDWAAGSDLGPTAVKVSSLRVRSPVTGLGLPVGCAGLILMFCAGSFLKRRKQPTG